MREPQVRAFLATSLDGFIAGPNDELDWLQGHGEDGVEDTFSPFFAEIGSMLMGRRTFDVVSQFDEWPYGDTSVLVATSRSLSTTQPNVEAVQGDIRTIVDQAKMKAGARDVYLDGGQLFRAALAEGLIDELTLTLVPTLLGDGIPLFGGVKAVLQPESCRNIGGGMLQIRYKIS